MLYRHTQEKSSGEVEQPQRRMATLSSIEGHLRSAREHAGREEYTAALVYFDGVLLAIDR